MNANSLNGAVLAYLGDSYYEHQIRVYLINKGITNTNKLHQTATNYTSGSNQALIMSYLIKENLLSEEELAIYKRGRNISHPGRKNLKMVEYHEATGFEALIGYLALKDYKRGNHIIDLAIKHIEENNGKRKS
ncbi:MAG: Mini-ribonuclease 3 [Acholeplasmataceae bacterium]|nr:Mini-ribonuclease 3 [Acholeplasmataceae bacterium]